MRALLISLAAVGAAVVVAGLGALVFIVAGGYEVAANVQHVQPVYTLLEATMRRSVQRRAAGITPPPLDGAELIARGALCFRDKCVLCHGGPGLAQGEIGRSMQPPPGPLVDARSRWLAAEVYWITRNGIRMSGMPAWQHRMADADLWAVVAFVQQLGQLSAAQFAQLAGPDAVGACEREADPADATAAADPLRGRLALTQYACNACHRIPGITGADVHVGPPLEGLGARGLIAGALPNTPEQLARWIRNPQGVDPHTTMPNMQVTERDARDIAAYLSMLR